MARAKDGQIQSGGATYYSANNTSGELVAAVSGKYIQLTDLVISVAEAGTVEITTGGTSGRVLIDNLHFAANGGMTCNYTVPLAGDFGANIFVNAATGTAGLTVHATYITFSHILNPLA